MARTHNFQPDTDGPKTEVAISCQIDHLPHVEAIFTSEALTDLDLEGLEIAKVGNRIELIFSVVPVNKSDPYRVAYASPDKSKTIKNMIVFISILEKILSPDYEEVLQKDDPIRLQSKFKATVDRLERYNQLLLEASTMLFRIGILYEYLIHFSPDLFPEDLQNEMKRSVNFMPNLGEENVKEIFPFGYHSVERKRFIYSIHADKRLEADWHNFAFSLSPLFQWFEMNKDYLFAEYGHVSKNPSLKGKLGQALKYIRDSIGQLLSARAEMRKDESDLLNKVLQTGTHKPQ